MGVAVEEPGKDGLSGEVDLVVAVEPTTDLDDAPVLDEDVRSGRVGPCAIDHEGTTEQRSRHGPRLP